MIGRIVFGIVVLAIMVACFCCHMLTVHIDMEPGDAGRRNVTNWQRGERSVGNKHFTTNGTKEDPSPTTANWIGADQSLFDHHE